jgi:leader peptidase (prepilin peptidase)/N-methyltransferase
MISKIFVFIVGIVIGSFLNVCISRIPENKSLLSLRNHCPKCKHKFNILEHISILGYIINNRKCRYCGERVSIQNPIVELLTAFIFLFLYNKFEFNISFFEYAILSSLLITMTFIDLERQEIPDKLIVFGLITSILFNIYDIKVNMINGIIGFILGGGSFLIIAMITHGAMGGGDIKLMAVLGLFLGWKFIIIVALISFILGAGASILLIAAKIKGTKDYIPFGPFIAVATITVIFYGQDILHMYINGLKL